MAPIKILLLEDSEEEFQEVERLLSKMQGVPYKLDWGQDFDDGLRVLRQKRYDICLLDGSFGMRGGIEFLREAKTNKVKTPFIFLADSVDRDTAALRAGASDYLVKKRIHPVFLQRAIRFALERVKTEEHPPAQEIRYFNLEKTPPHRTLEELRDNLSTLGGLTKVAAERSKGDSKLTSLLDAAFKNCAESLSLTERLLDNFSQNNTLNKKISIRQFVLDTIDRITPTLVNGFTISTSLGRKDDLVIEGSSRLLTQVLTGIIQAYQNYIPTTLNIKTESFIQNFVKLSFKIKNTKNNKRQTESQKIALAAATKILQLHKAWYKLNNNGLISEIYFPLYHPTPSTPQKIPMLRAVPIKGTILIIDADELFAGLTQLYFEAAGFSVKLFSDPFAALAWYANHTADVNVIFMEMNLPNVSGVECFSILRDLNPQAKIALFSELPSLEGQTLLKQGALKFFQKPAEYPSIVAWTSEIINS